jgi:hypothetical protein
MSNQSYWWKNIEPLLPPIADSYEFNSVAYLLAYMCIRCNELAPTLEGAHINKDLFLVSLSQLAGLSH